jgi:hypothetical protein
MIILAISEAPANMPEFPKMAAPTLHHANQQKTNPHPDPPVKNITQEAMRLGILGKKEKASVVFVEEAQFPGDDWPKTADCRKRSIEASIG